MWGLRRAVTCLAVVAAAGLRAHALPPTTVSADALHAVEDSVDRIGGAPTYIAAAQDLDPELEAGCESFNPHAAAIVVMHCHMRHTSLSCQYGGVV